MFVKHRPREKTPFGQYWSMQLNYTSFEGTSLKASKQVTSAKKNTAQNNTLKPVRDLSGSLEVCGVIRRLTEQHE